MTLDISAERSEPAHGPTHPPLAGTRERAASPWLRPVAAQASAHSPAGASGSRIESWMPWFAGPVAPPTAAGAFMDLSLIHI